MREPAHFIDWIQRSSNSFSVPCDARECFSDPGAVTGGVDDQPVVDEERVLRVVCGVALQLADEAFDVEVGREVDAGLGGHRGALGAVESRFRRARC